MQPVESMCPRGAYSYALKIHAHGHFSHTCPFVMNDCEVGCWMSPLVVKFNYDIFHTFGWGFVQLTILSPLKVTLKVQSLD